MSNEMMLFVLILFSYCISTSHETASLDDENLRLDLVQVLFRHGIRTPLVNGINSCNIVDSSAYESYGFGELTNEGKDQEHKFGLFLRHRYNDYLSIRYKPEDVYVYSSDSPRVKTSLEFLLDGLFPAVGPAVWNPHLKWSRIPYLYTPGNWDILLGTYKNPKLLELFAETLKSDELASKMANYSDFFNFVKEKKLVNNCSSSLLATGLTYEVLVVNKHMQLPLPIWYTPEVKEKFDEAVISFALDTFAGTKEKQRLGAGSLIKTFIDNLNLNGKNVNSKKLYLYAGHDINIYLFARAHGIRDFKVPNFGSALIMEKFLDSKNQTYVRLLAWDGIDKLETLKLGNHTEFCPINEYLKITESLLLSEKEINELLNEAANYTSLKRMISVLVNVVNNL